jgi:hypothetical protein
MFADIVDKERSDGATVVGRCDGTISFLAGGIPDLCLDRLCVNADTSGGELDADRRLAIEVELVAGEAGQKVGFADAGVSDEDDFEEELCTSDRG